MCSRVPSKSMRFQNGCPGAPSKPLCAQNGCPRLPSRSLRTRNGRPGCLAPGCLRGLCALEMAAPAALEATVRSTCLPTGGAFKATAHSGLLLAATAVSRLRHKAFREFFEVLMPGTTEPCITALCCTLHRCFAHLLGAAEGRSSYLLCHWTLDEAFENAARSICPRPHLRSMALHSAPHYTVHGYAPCTV